MFHAVQEPSAVRRVSLRTGEQHATTRRAKPTKSYRAGSEAAAESGFRPLCVDTSCGPSRHRRYHLDWYRGLWHQHRHVGMDSDLPPKKGYGRGLVVLVLLILLLIAIAGFWIVFLPQTT